MNDISTLSIFDRYEVLRKVNPAKDLVDTICKATGRSESSVRMWISSKRYPPKNLQRLIADALGSTIEILFPKQ